jgi:hypothetical protein
MNEWQQRDFFLNIINSPVSNLQVGEDEQWDGPPITINISALLDTLPQLHESLEQLDVTNFVLTRQSDVQALAKIIARCKTLRYLTLNSIECSVCDCDRQDSDESNGFFDPLFYAASGLDGFCVSTKTLSAHSSLVSPAALRALLGEGKRSGLLSLSGLGLTDSHVLAIVDSLSTPGSRLGDLELTYNPDITDQGYGALLNLINQANVIGRVFLCKWDEPDESCSDEKAWEDKICLVSEMNSHYGRLEYMTNGMFTSEEHKLQWLERVTEEHKLQWLERVADHPRPCDRDEKEWDEKHLNFIWYTLCQNPEMMQT